MECPEPKLLKQHEKLWSLIGNWEGDEVMAPSHWMPEGGTRVGTLKTKKSCDGYFIAQEYNQKDGRKSVFKGHGVFGYDAMAKNYVMHWFDTLGCATVATGTWRGKRLVFSNESPMGHGRYIYTLKSEDELSFKMEHSQDGEKWTWLMKATYHRK